VYLWRVSVSSDNTYLDIPVPACSHISFDLASFGNKKGHFGDMTFDVCLFSRIILLAMENCF
jgi:hypothetical protein